MFRIYRGKILQNRRKIGTAHENEAVLFLKNRGYKIIEKNFYCRYGEIDIIAQDGDYIVFIEVKYRKNCNMGSPETAVDYNKKKHIIQSAQYYLYSRYNRNDIPARFDVVAIQGKSIHLIKNAFEV